MEMPPSTRPSLLIRIRDHRDVEAWRQFVDLYAPLIYRLARRRGLQDADAADLTQEVLQKVSHAAARLNYDACKGTFRGWLFTITQNRVTTFLGRKRRLPQTRQDQGFFEAQPAREEEKLLWEQEYEQRLFDWAAEQVRDCFQERTWQAFWQTAVDGRTPAQAAMELGISVGAVYIARSRVLNRLRERIQEVVGE
jgi:RNA polymerase sigma-70 factor (ECF subfamily)